MSVSFKIHTDLGYVAIAFEGPVTLQDLAKNIQDVWSDPAWKPTYNGIIDCSKGTLTLSEAEIQMLTKSMKDDPRCSRGRWGLVVSTAADFAKLRKIDPVADTLSTIRLFFDRRSAEDWLLSRPRT